MGLIGISVYVPENPKSGTYNGIFVYLCGMSKAWAEITVSKLLRTSIEKDGKLSDFENKLHEDLSKFIGIKLAENKIAMTDEIKGKIQFDEETDKNGDVTYHAVVYV